MKSLSPGQLSESVRARLEQRAAGRHPSSLPAPGTRDSQQAATLPAPSARGTADEPLRRGQARQRRVQAVETAEGVTVLSNRIEQLPEPRLASVAVQRPSAPEVTAEEEELALPASGDQVTETRALRPIGARPAKAKVTNEVSFAWLAWPFVLLLTTGAVVGTLWFRKKTG